MHPLEQPPHGACSLEGLATIVSYDAFRDASERMRRALFYSEESSALRPVWDELGSKIERDLLRQDVPEQEARLFADVAAHYYQGLADAHGDHMVLKHGCVSFWTPVGGRGQLDFGLSGPGFRREARLLFRGGRWKDLREINPSRF